VSFEPELEDLKICKALIRKREMEVGPYFFDGTQLFTTRTFQPDPLRFKMEFETRDNAGQPTGQNDSYAVTIKFVRTCDTTEPIAFQLFNMLIKKCQGLLKLSLMGRHFYDGDQAIKIDNHKLEMWPGFVTSMRQQETEVLLNVDLSFKILRQDNVLSLMRDIRAESPQNFQQLCNEAIVGTVIMTPYNRKTYRIDEIDWNRNPNCTFPKMVNGKEVQVSFLEYYQKRHRTKIQMPGQPLLLSRPKIRDIRRGDTGDIALIPELCHQTGLTQSMRSNFRLMKDLSQYLHMLPTQRLNQTRKFINRLRDSTDVSAELSKWGMRFKPDPVEVSGRILLREKIQFQNGLEYPNDKADWGHAFRSKFVFCSFIRCSIFLY